MNDFFINPFSLFEIECEFLSEDLGIPLCSCTDKNQYCSINCPDMQELAYEIWNFEQERGIKIIDRNKKPTVQSYLEAGERMRNLE